MSRSEVFVDSSVLVGLHLGDPKARDLVRETINQGNILVINPVVFSETVYKVMFTLAIQDGLKGPRDLKKHLSEYLFVYKKVDESLKKLRDAGFLRILPISEKTIELASEIGEKYQLLPNDALIVATCAEHEIERILTFDSDFEKVPLIKVVR